MGHDEGALRQRVKGMIVLCCRLKMLPAELKDDQELFDPAKGPGLDSIDVLELVVNLEREFGVVIPDRDTGRRVLRNVDTIVEFIRAPGKK
jgi:acyl carrier protein